VERLREATAAYAEPARRTLRTWLTRDDRDPRVIE
jgi:hypothetical protein